MSEEQRAGFDFDGLVDQAKRLPVDTFDRHVRRKVQDAQRDHGLADTKAKQAASEFRHWFDQRSGMGKFSGSLDPERYEVLTNAIDHRASAIAAAGDDTVARSPNLSARALVELVSEPGGSDRRGRVPSVTVVVDHKTLAEGPHADSVKQTEGGHHIASQSLARICCDAVVRRVVFDDAGVPVDVGRRYRTATDAQWAALKAMYSSCGWDGCLAPIGWCQAHHITEWEHGGPTDLDNLIPLCSQHHHRVHEGQWSIKLLPDRTLKIHRPNGELHATVPTPMRC